MSFALSPDGWNPAAGTTWRAGSTLPRDVLAGHLRVMIARVLRTGRGPEPLVAWVRRQSADLAPGSGDSVEQLTVRLLALFHPPTTRTVRG